MPLKGKTWIWIALIILIIVGILFATGVIKLPATSTTATKNTDLAAEKNAGGKIVNMK